MSQDYLARFSGLARLHGRAAMEALAKAHFALVGLGGVGSWAAEALARSGVGELTLIEMDDVCITNTNRQSHALQSQLGKPKIEVVGARLRDINPELKLHLAAEFLTADNMQALLGPRHHVVIDAIDSASVKTALVAYCSALKMRLVTVGSSGGKRDPLKVTVADLGQTRCDPLLAKVRNQLYRHYNFSRDAQRRFRVDAVYSPEQMVYPATDGRVSHTKQGFEKGSRLDCASGIGSSVMVTGTFGFAAANRAIERYLQMVKPE